MWEAPWHGLQVGLDSKYQEDCSGLGDKFDFLPQFPAVKAVFKHFPA